MPNSAGRQILETPFGAPLEIHAGRDAVSAIFFNLDRRVSLPDRPNALTRAAAGQLLDYFSGKRKVFSLPLASLAADSPATDYQRKVWGALLGIPYGQTCTYADIAGSVGGGARAVGTTNGRNPLCIAVPCHRVVRKDGLGGYGGPLIREKGPRLLKIKRLLLEHEQRHL